jgi:uncharacterized protein DUF5522
MLEEDEFYMENGKFVLTERYHLKRGECCGNGCRHCPFGHRAVPPRMRHLKDPPWPYFKEQPLQDS